MKRKRRQIVAAIAVDIDERVPDNEVATHVIVLVAKHDTERAATRVVNVEVLELQDESGEWVGW